MLDIFRGDPVREWFFTESAGVPTTLAGSPAAKAFIATSLTGVTTGVTLTNIDAGGIVGSHRVEIDTSDQSVYIPGSRVTVKLSAGTVGGDSVVGVPICVFTIEKVYDGRAFEGTAQGVAAGALTLDALDTAASIGDIIYIFTAATGAMQRRTIIDLPGSSVATLDRNFSPTPTGTIVYRRYSMPLATTAAEDATAILAAATAAGGIDADVKAIANANVIGDGTPGNKWRAQ